MSDSVRQLTVSSLTLSYNVGRITFYLIRTCLNEYGWQLLKKEDEMDIFPIGSVIAFAGPVSKIPSVSGWIPCDGRLLKRDDFPQLFDAIGTLHGAGDNVGTFNIPDFRGYFLRGVTGESSTDRGLSKRIPLAFNNPKNEAGSVQHPATALPANPFVISPDGNHTHQDPTWNGQGGPFEVATENRGPGGVDFGREAHDTTENGTHTHNLSGGGDEETRPINKYVHWIIKVR
jgi:Phage Tail Collar Domain